jgi:hypothetical protein
MTQLKVTVRDNEVRTINERLTLAVKRLPAGIMRPIVDEGVEELRTDPAERPGQRYVRTGARYSRTRAEYTGGQSYRFVSDPTYRGRSADPYVLGDARGQGQAWMHRGRWKTMRAVVERVAEKIVAAAGAEFRRIIGQGGVGL